MEAKIAGLIERIKPYPGVLLGSADTAPRGTPLETFRLIQHLVGSLGSYRAVGSYRPGEFLAAQEKAASRASDTPSPAVQSESVAPTDMGQVLLELARRLDEKRPEVTGTIKFNVTGERIYRLFITQGKCRLEASDGPADASMTANPKNLLALFTGKLNPMAAFMTRKIKFDGNLQLLGVLSAAK